VVIAVQSIIKNKAVLTLTSANIAETFGVSIFNIILLTYAKSFPNSTIMVSIVSVATVIPGVFGFLAGRMADSSLNKGRYLIIAKLAQAVMYIILGLVITKKTAFIFFIVILVNVLSDFLGNYSSDLRLPIIKNKVGDDDRQQVIGLNQSISALLAPIGQSLGIAIIGITHDYALAGFVNAITFLIAAVILFYGRNRIDIPLNHQEKKVVRNKKNLLKKTMTILGQSTGINVIPLLITVLLVNGVGASMDALVNLFLLNHEHLTFMPFSVEILVVNILYILGMVSGSVSKISIIDKLSFKVIMGATIILMILLLANFAMTANYWILVVMMFLTSFSLAKINPKIMAEIMKMADDDMIGTVSGTLGSLVSVTIPIGSIGLVLLYNVVSPASSYYTSIGLLLISLLVLVFNRGNKKENS